jgi:hypothetical protein
MIPHSSGSLSKASSARRSSGLSCPVLLQLAGIRESELHDCARRKNPEASLVAFALVESLRVVLPARAGMDEEWHGVPRMALERARRGVVARHDEDVRLEPDNEREILIDLLYHLYLALEIAVFPERVRFLDMDEEEVVAPLVRGAQRLELLFDRKAGVEEIHSAELGHAPVEGIGCNGGGGE